jgi:hypothetical protein
VTDTLVWAAVVFVPLMTLVLLLAPALRRAIEAVTAAHTVSAAERDAGVQAALAGIAERRHKLAISQALLPEETEAERARLAAEAAQYDTDREAWGKVLDTAVATHREVLAARAEAEAELAPEVARKALEGGAGEEMASLSQAYAAYCRECVGTPWAFGQWIDGFDGLGR